MGEADTCVECNQWEEKMYWNNFHKIHFYLCLAGDFASQMAIPKKFANCLQDKLPEPSSNPGWSVTLTLRGPSGSTWKVGLVTRGDDMFFKHGWNEFVSKHSLQENDLLVFKYNGELCLDVLMFDHRSSCEKPASYFVRKCGHNRVVDNGGYMTPETTPEFTRDSSVEVTEVKFNDGVGSSMVRKPSFDEFVTSTPLARRSVSRGIIRSEIAAPDGGSSDLVSSTKKRRKKETSILTTDETGNLDAEQKAASRSGMGYQIMFMSNRRPITDLEKQRTLQLAQTGVTNQGFVLIMRPTHVYKRFFVSIPTEWANAYMSPENQEVMLQYNDKTWRSRFYHDRNRHCGGIAGGWKDFAVENNLEEFDVCKFELASPKDSPIVLNVTIFRVVEELAPLMRITSAEPLRLRITSAVPLRQKVAGDPPTIVSS